MQNYHTEHWSHVLWPVRFLFSYSTVLSCAHIFRDQHSGGDTLQSCGISEGSTVNFSLSTFSDETSYNETFYINDVVPSVQQTQKGISVFLSSFYALVSYYTDSGAVDLFLEKSKLIWKDDKSCNKVAT